MRERLLWFIGGGVVFFVLFLLFGGLYTITPPNGPVDTAYKMNRLTGKVWLVKTYSKQIGQIRVLTAREAEVEKTKLAAADGELAAAAVRPVAANGSRRR